MEMMNFKLFLVNNIIIFHVPAVFLNLMLAFGVMSCFLTILVINTHFKPEEEEIPKSVESIANCIAKMVCWKQYGCCRRPDNSTVDVLSLSEKNNSENTPVKGRGNGDLTWQDVARILDALFFCAYAWLLIITVALFTYIMTLRNTL